HGIGARRANNTRGLPYLPGSAEESQSHRFLPHPRTGDQERQADRRKLNTNEQRHRRSRKGARNRPPFPCRLLLAHCDDHGLGRGARATMKAASFVTALALCIALSACALQGSGNDLAGALTEVRAHPEQRLNAEVSCERAISRRSTG